MQPRRSVTSAIGENGELAMHTCDIKWVHTFRRDATVGTMWL